MKKISFASLFLILIIVVSMSPSVSATSVTFDNDGLVRENPYGDCGIAPSFNAEYYDCYVPYNMKLGEIGGYSIGKTWSSPDYRSWDGIMPENYRNFYVSQYTNRENDMSLSSERSTNLTRSHEGDTDCVLYTAPDGTVFYVCALPKWCFNNSMAGSNGFPDYSLANRCQVFDVILTDGTVIHFLVGDTIGAQHSNGGDAVEQQEFDIVYDFTALNYEQYRFLFHAQTAQTIEIWGKSSCASKFNQKYNIGGDEGENRIAYIRMYSMFAYNGVERNSGVPAGSSYSLGSVTINSNGSEGNSANQQGATGIVPMSHLTGMPVQSPLSSSGSAVTLPSRDQLSIQEQYGVASTTDAIAERNKLNTYDFARRASVFVGLCLVMYDIFIILSYLFDKVNSFIDIRLVTLFSLGTIHLVEDRGAPPSPGHISHTRFYVVCILIFLIGALLISGGVIPAIMKAVHWVLSGIGGLF